jgi:hypothetical protein
MCRVNDRIAKNTNAQSAFDKKEDRTYAIIPVRQ